MNREADGEMVHSVRHDGDVLIVSVQGEVDLNNSPELRGTMLQLLKEHKPRRLIMNLAAVPYMDSSAVAVLVELLRKIGKTGKVVLTELQPRVRNILEIARLHSIFVIANSEQEAMAR